MKKILFTLAAFCSSCFAIVSPAQQSVQKFNAEIYEYLLYLPEGYGEELSAKWPLVIFLHGAGETGTDIEKIKLHGLPKLVEQGHRFPFIGVSPQTKTYGWNPAYVAMLAEEIAEKYSVDRDRLYLTGLSMGGFGTWATAQAYPGLFAAIMPICGGGDPDRAYALSTTAIWNFHGDADNVVPIDRSNRIMEALPPFNPGAKYTVYPGVAHDSWTQTYENPDVWEWLLAQRKFRYRQENITPQQMDEYTGVYAPSGEDGKNIVTIERDGDKLLSKGYNGNPVQVYFAGNDTFFLDPDTFDYLRFERGDNGKIEGAVQYSARGMERVVKKQ